MWMHWNNMWLFNGNSDRTDILHTLRYHRWQPRPLANVSVTIDRESHFMIKIIFKP